MINKNSLYSNFKIDRIEQGLWTLASLHFSVNLFCNPIWRALERKSILVFL